MGTEQSSFVLAIDIPRIKSFSRGVDFKRSIILSTPSFLSPLFTRILLEFGKRVNFVPALPAHGRAVTEPISSPPRPILGRILVSLPL